MPSTVQLASGRAIFVVARTVKVLFGRFVNPRRKEPSGDIVKPLIVGAGGGGGGVEPAVERS
jgi:hypothetical protein